jgi:hypothetical protein
METQHFEPFYCLKNKTIACKPLKEKDFAFPAGTNSEKTERAFFTFALHLSNQGALFYLECSHF